MTRVIGSMLAATLVLGGCAVGDGGASGRLRVVVSVYPVFEAASRVAGDRADVSNLTPPGAEPHDLELTAQDLAQLEGADLVLYLGRGFQPAFEEAAGRRSGPTVDLLEGLDLLAGEHHEEDDHAGEGDGDEADHAGEDDGDGLDPHVWLDPLRMQQMTDAIARALASVDPDGAASYTSNAGTFHDALGALHEEYRAGLGDCARRVFVTAHAAFGYLADRYGLEQESIAGISPESEPTAPRLEELRRVVQREEVTTIFTEALVSSRIADTLAREAGVTVEVLDPLESLTQEQRAQGEEYLSVMRDNLAKLADALGCAA